VWNDPARWVRACVVACLAMTGLAVVVPAAPAAAANCVDPCIAFAPVPWPQRMFDVERVWSMTRGGGVRVAVIDSGVDAGHPQLQGRVAAGTDFITPGGNGQVDCAGHGTQVAGIIAAQPQQSVGFHGIAPQATIVPIRYIGESDNQSAGVAGIANGIRFAINSGARVIVVPQASYFADDNLAGAVRQAVAADIVVVAGVGEDGGTNGAKRTPYPAAFDGVIGVTAVKENTLVADDSGRGAYVDLAAPGVQVVSTQRGGGLTVANGTAFAAAFVAGAAALVRSWWPKMTAAEVTKRLLATASPAPGGIDNGT
jgi:membrane-anchored mycosin MYCP